MSLPPSSSLVLLTALQLLACGRSGGALEDARTYGDVAANPSTEPGRDLARCALISDPGTRGDCELMVVQRQAEADHSAPEEGCPAIAHDTWRHECYFQAAEHWAKAGKPERAVPLCAQAGPFKDDCGQHLWQDDMSAIIGRKGSKRLSRALPAAQRLHDTWVPHLNEEGDFAWRFWRRFYEMGFEPERRLDLRDCAPLPGHHAQLCEIAAGRVFMRRLSDRTMMPQGLQGLCSLQEPVSTDALAATLPGMDVVAHPLLTAVLAEQQARRCAEGGGTPEADGPSELVGPQRFREVIEAAEALPEGG